MTIHRRVEQALIAGLNPLSDSGLLRSSGVLLMAMMGEQNRLREMASIFDDQSRPHRSATGVDADRPMLTRPACGLPVRRTPERPGLDQLTFPPRLHGASQFGAALSCRTAVTGTSISPAR